jgi:Tol biopolymer transport system component
MVGVQMARHWHIVQNEMGILIFTQYPLMEEKKRLTISDGLDDGPDYSSDGKYIYFNSYRTGHMQIWRMQSDGTNQEQLTFDDNSNWFAHPPDNKWIVFISYV